MGLTGILGTAIASADSLHQGASSNPSLPDPPESDGAASGSDRASRPPLARVSGHRRPIKKRRALRAINRELGEQAYMRQNISGFLFYWQRDDCWYRSRKAIQCDAWIIQDMGGECEFAGYYGRTFSWESAWVIARKLPGSNRVATGFGYTYDYYYCYS